MGAYLDQLERELDRVDTFVRSGNLMVDAILNSKLTLARRQEVAGILFYTKCTDCSRK